MTLKNSFPHVEVFYKKIIGTKFNEDIIIKWRVWNRNKTKSAFVNMESIFEMKWLR
jgi:hypothetical protein